MIIAIETTRDRNISHKNVIEAPTSVENTPEIDRKNLNDFWRKAIRKHVHAVGGVLEIINEKDKVPYG